MLYKDFEAYKHDIFSLQLKSPGKLRPGQISIALNSGKSINIFVSGQEAYQKLKAMLWLFYPQLQES